MLFLQKPRYYDAPDGQAPYDKVMSTVRKAAALGAAAGIVDCVHFSDIRTPLQALNCLAYWVVPMIGIGATGAAVTFASTRIRGKDDPWNYGLGGLACFPIIHGWSKSTQLSCWATVFLAASGMIAHQKHLYKWDFIYAEERQWGHMDHDWSLIEEYDKDFRSPYIGTLL